MMQRMGMMRLLNLLLCPGSAATPLTLQEFLVRVRICFSAQVQQPHCLPFKNSWSVSDSSYAFVESAQTIPAAWHIRYSCCALAKRRIPA